MESADLFATWFFWIHSCPNNDSISRFDSLSQVKKSTGIDPPGLACPDLDQNLFFAWDAFQNIGYDLNWQTLKAYIDITGESLSRLEVSAIQRFARAKIEVNSGRRNFDTYIQSSDRRS